jgi:hypothetical protein
MAHLLCSTEKSGASAKTERERERERVRCGEWVKKGCGVGRKLDQWSSIYEGVETG